MKAGRLNSLLAIGRYSGPMTQSIPDALLDTVNRTFDFTGRSSRKQFWTFIACYIVVASLIPFFGSTMPESGMLSDSVEIEMAQILSDYMLRQGLLFAVFVIPLMSVTTRRLHDVGWSGLWAAPLLILHLAVFLLQAKVLADSVQSFDPVQSPFYGTLMTLSMIYNAAAIGIAILCVLRSNPTANGHGDPQFG